MKNLSGIFGLFLTIILFNFCEKKEDKFSSKDGDGNVYSSVKIGTQEWLKENLRTTKYNDGSDIPLGTMDSDASTPRYWWYNDDQATYGNTYGALYNWYAVKTGKLCPAGWHVPSHSEWWTLINFVGGEYVAGNRLKESGNSHWATIGSTNEYGFTALPAGNFAIGTFSHIGEIGQWWTSTEESAHFADDFFMEYNSAEVIENTGYAPWGFSVRCLKDK